MGFISKFILPKEADFIAGLRDQSKITAEVVNALGRACNDLNSAALAEIRFSRNRGRELKDKNMRELLDVFITPYDKESIYRIITQFDWVMLSVKHLVTEIEVYEIKSLQDYQDIFVLLSKMAELLDSGIKGLAGQELRTIDAYTDKIHELYDEVVELCAKEKFKLLYKDDFKYILMQKDILMQLKEIAKRIHVTANTLEDMALKVV